MANEKDGNDQAKTKVDLHDKPISGFFGLTRRPYTVVLGAARSNPEPSPDRSR